MTMTTLKQRFKQRLALWLRQQADRARRIEDWAEYTLSKRLEYAIYQWIARPSFYAHFWLLDQARKLSPPSVPLDFDDDIPF